MRPKKRNRSLLEMKLDVLQDIDKRPNIALTRYGGISSIEYARLREIIASLEQAKLIQPISIRRYNITPKGRDTLNLYIQLKQALQFGETK